MSELGDYLRVTRLNLGLSLREAEDLAQVSNAYISMIESGKRADPHPNILRKLAKAYGLKLRDLMEKAGYLGTEEDADDEKAEIERMYREAISDPEFAYGRRSKANVDFGTKRLIANMYKRLKKKK